MHKLKFLTLALFVMITLQLSGQTKDDVRAEQYVNDQEQFRKSMLLREYDSALFLMDEEKYQKADEKFKYVLDNIKSVPSDLTYHFGRNSFHLGKYKQCIDWLNKYIQLKGTSGQFYAQAVDWKAKAEGEYLKEKNNDTNKVQEVLSTDYDIDCGASGKVVCPVCKGNHVVIRKGTFGDEYKTCGYCNEHGILTCEEYNKLLRGELKPRG